MKFKIFYFSIYHPSYLNSYCYFRPASDGALKSSASAPLITPEDLIYYSLENLCHILNVHLSILYLTLLVLGNFIFYYMALRHLTIESNLMLVKSNVWIDFKNSDENNILFSSFLSQFLNLLQQKKYSFL